METTVVTFSQFLCVNARANTAEQLLFVQMSNVNM